MQVPVRYHIQLWREMEMGNAICIVLQLASPLPNRGIGGVPPRQYIRDRSTSQEIKVGHIMGEKNQVRVHLITDDPIGVSPLFLFHSGLEAASVKPSGLHPQGGCLLLSLR